MSKVYRIKGKKVNILTYIRNEFQRGFRNSDYNLKRIEKLIEKEDELSDRIINEFNYCDTPERWQVEDEMDKLTAKRRKIEDLPYSFAWENRRMRRMYGEHYSNPYNFELNDDDFFIEYGLDKKDLQ